MSQYSYLSKPDPEFAALLEQIQHNKPPPLVPPVDIAAAQQCGQRGMGYGSVFT